MSSASVASRPNVTSDGSTHKSQNGVQHDNQASKSSASSVSSKQPQAQKQESRASVQNGNNDGSSRPNGHEKDEWQQHEGKDAEDNDKTDKDDQEYPEQLHAGHLDGLGPEYGKMNKVTMSDRIQGVKEHIKGALKRDPELKHKGQERMTGELKQKEKEEDNPNPFGTAGGDDKKEGGDEEGDVKNDGTEGETAEKMREQDRHAQDEKSSSQKGIPKDSKQKEPGSHEAKESIDEGKQTEKGTTDVPHAHPTEKGREEQAASVKPEGTDGPSRPEESAHDKASAAEPN